MAKQPKTETTPPAEPKNEKPIACKIAGRLGLGVAIVQGVFSKATKEDIAKVIEAFEAGSHLLGELFCALRKPKKQPPPEAQKTE